MVVVWSGLWRIIIKPVEGGTYTFDGGGGVLSSIELTLQRDGSHQFKVVLINDNGTYNSMFEIGDLIEIYLDDFSLGNTKRLTGIIKKPTYSRKGPLNTLALTGYAYKDKFKRATVIELYQGPRSYYDIITNTQDGLIAKYAPGVTTTGVQDSGKNLLENELLRLDYTNLYETLERLKGIVGDWMWDVSPLLSLVFQPIPTPPATKVLDEFGDVDFSYDDKDLVNRVYVIGGRDYGGVDKSEWHAFASENNDDATLAINGIENTGWDSRAPQNKDQWFIIDLGKPQIIGQMLLDNNTFGQDKFARNFRVDASKSENDDTWKQIFTVAGNLNYNVMISFPQEEFRYIKVTITDGYPANWCIGEIYLYNASSLIAVAQDTASQTQYGKYERPVKDSSVLTLPQARQRAKEEITKNKAPFITGDVSLNYFFDVSPNDKVAITVPGTPITGDFLVEKVMYTESTKGTFREQISLRSV